MENFFLLLFVLSFLVLAIWAVHAIMRLTVKRGLFSKFRTKHYVISFVGLFVVGFGGFAMTTDDVDPSGEQTQSESTTEEAEADTESASDSSGGSSEEVDSSENSASNEESQSTEEETTSNEETTETESTPGVGDYVTVGEVAYTVNEAGTATTVGDEYLQQQANGVYVAIDVTFENNGSEAVDIDSSYMKLKLDGNTYEPDATATSYANTSGGSSTDFLYSSVNPGSSLRGYVVYDVTEEVATSPGLRMEAAEGFFGTNTATIDITPSE